MRETIKLTSLSIVTALVLSGCGSSSSSDTTPTENSNSDIETKTGYFIDAAVAGVDYITTSELNGTTDRFGRFKYNEGDKVKLYIGKLLLGEVTPTEEGLITPKTLASQSEDSAKTESLILRVLQSLDKDSNTTNGITISQSTTNRFYSLDSEVEITSLEESNLTSIPEIGSEIDNDNDGIIDVTEEEAQNHFTESIQTWDEGHRPDENEVEDEAHGNAEVGSENANSETHGNAEAGSENANSEAHGNAEAGSENANSETHGNAEAGSENNTTETHGSGLDLESYPSVTLTDKQKYALAYMWNEEKLAYEVYSELNKVQPQKQLENIATRSEIKHIQMVEDLVQKYDINITNLDTYEVKYSEAELRALPVGTFGVEPIQALYNTLYDKGIKSGQDALEVGCMVEVTDVNDLIDYIAIAQEINATDIVDTFDKLKAGSYNHYWSFDKGLKNMGITEGCCSLGTIDGVDYCQPDYPQNEESSNENGHSEENSSESSNEESNNNAPEEESRGNGNGGGKNHQEE